MKTAYSVPEFCSTQKQRRLNYRWSDSQGTEKPITRQDASLL